jgi:hypothetical protein
MNSAFGLFAFLLSLVHCVPSDVTEELSSAYHQDDRVARIFSLNRETTIDDLYFFQDEAIEAGLDFRYYSRVSSENTDDLEYIKITIVFNDLVMVTEWNLADLPETTEVVQFGWWQDEQGTAIELMKFDNSN